MENQGTTQQVQQVQSQASKKWYKSRTIIFNLLVAIFTGLSAILQEEAFKSMVGENFPYVLTVVTIMNIFLRSITVEPVKV